MDRSEILKAGSRLMLEDAYVEKLTNPGESNASESPHGTRLAVELEFSVLLVAGFKWCRWTIDSHLMGDTVSTFQNSTGHKSLGMSNHQRWGRAACENTKEGRTYMTSRHQTFVPSDPTDYSPGGPGDFE
jgi:hypothetical protein